MNKTSSKNIAILEQPKNKNILASSASFVGKFIKSQGKVAKQAYKDSNLDYHIQSVADATAQVQKQASTALDTASGKAMYDLVKQRLDLQDQYNNLLATKLHEALHRIKLLEKQVK